MKESKATDGYFDKTFDSYLVPVAAGFFGWSGQKNLAFTTTLGSCVSVCVSDMNLGIGGINHFLLPDLPGGGGHTASEAARYGSAAIEILLNALYANGAARNDLVVKVFGGGKVVSGVSADVGGRNAEFARTFFRNERIRVTSEDTGGKTGRKVIFFPSSGRALVRPVMTSQDIDKIAEKELKTYQRLEKTRTEGDVELF